MNVTSGMIVFCECGRPALPGSRECRTCYEDALRRTWRDQFRAEASLGTPQPVRMVNARLRSLYAEPDTENQASGGSRSARTGLPVDHRQE